MDVNDVKIVKDALEQQISAVIQEFTAVTGMLLTNLELKYYNKYDMGMGATSSNIPRVFVTLNI